MHYCGKLTKDVLKRIYITKNLVIKDKEYVLIERRDANFDYFYYEVPELGEFFYETSFVYIKPVYEPKYKNFVDKLMEIE